MTHDATRVPDPASEPPNFRARRVAAFGAVVVVGLGAFYLGTVAFRSADVPAGTTVLGVTIGGMTRDEAVTALSTALADRTTQQLDARVGRAHITVDPVDAGLSFDAAATVDGVVGRDLNPFSLLGSGAGQDVAPVIRVQQQQLDQVVATIAADTDEPVQEPEITFTRLQPQLVAGETGRALDQAGAAAAITSAFLRTDSVSLPVAKVHPSIDESGASAGLASAAAAVAEPVSVGADAVTATIRRGALARALSYTGADGRFTARLDGDVLRASIARQVAPVETPGRDARWRIKRGKPVVVPSKVGRGVNAEHLATAVAEVLERTGADRAVQAPIGPIEPALTTADARALNITEQLSTFTQPFPYAAYRSQNIGQAAKYLDGTLLRPGDTFSMNDTIKERTVANGYTRGFIVGPGGVFQEDLGGGVSTATSAVWTAAFFAGLERVHTQAHSIWIPRYQAGLEATVAWGFFDMQFRNDTPSGVLITTRMTPTSITVSMWGTKVYDKIRAESGPRTGIVPYRTVYNTSPTCHSQSGVSGFSIVVTRVFVKDRKVVKREPIRTRYIASPQVVCGPDPTKKTKPEKPDPSAKPRPSTSPTR